MDSGQGRGQTGQEPSSGRWWLNRTVLGIVLATFFSDACHEMATALLPLYLSTIGLGPAALGLIEGLADLLNSVSKLVGGFVGHYVRRKQPLAAAGYLVTACATGAIGLVRGLGPLVTLRTVAWIGRGFRAPLRDFLLADAVERTHYGRAYGLERAGDMLGAVVGPLLATLLVAVGLSVSTVVLGTLFPGLVAAAAMFFIVRERVNGQGPGKKEVQPAAAASSTRSWVRLPAAFWWFLIGVFLFGLGDFSRTFLIWLVVDALGGPEQDLVAVAGTLSLATLLYTLHNGVSAAAAIPAGQWGDRWSKLRVLQLGYAIGVATNLILAWHAGSIAWLAIAIVMSGVYIAIEETIEKAVVADVLPREVRSLGLGILACTNAVGDMASSLYVGVLLHAGYGPVAFLIAAGCGAVGLAWIGAAAAVARKSARGDITATD